MFQSREDWTRLRDSRNLQEISAITCEGWRALSGDLVDDRNERSGVVPWSREDGGAAAGGTGSGETVLLRVEYQRRAWRDRRDAIAGQERLRISGAFLLWQFSCPEFQPPK